MSVHLLATVNQWNRVLNDIDFEQLLRLSNGECIIAEGKMFDYLGSSLPDRFMISVGEPAMPIAPVAVRSTVEDALALFAGSGCKDAVVLGQSKGFLSEIIEHTDVVHVTILDGNRDDRIGDFIALPSEKWTITHHDMTRGDINGPFKRKIQRRYRRSTGDNLEWHPKQSSRGPSA